MYKDLQGRLIMSAYNVMSMKECKNNACALQIQKMQLKALSSVYCSM